MPTRSRPIANALVYPHSQVAAQTDEDHINMVSSPRLKRWRGQESGTGSSGLGVPKGFETWEFIHEAFADASDPADDSWLWTENEWIWIPVKSPADFSSSLDVNIYWYADVTTGTVRWRCRIIPWTTPPATETVYEVDATSNDGTVETATNATEAGRPNTSVINLGAALGADRLGFAGILREADHANDDMEDVAHVVYIDFSYTGS